MIQLLLVPLRAVGARIATTAVRANRDPKLKGNIDFAASIISLILTLLYPKWFDMSSIEGSMLKSFLKSDIKELAKNDLYLESKIVENYDDLEAKNFVVKRDVDTVIEEHEMFLEQLEDKFINNNEGGNNE